MTVRGAVPADALGITLPHEHILLNLEWIDARFSLDGILNDADLAVEELRAFADAGGHTLVDLSNRGMRPDPCAIRAVSQKTGINVVLGCGWYRQSHYPAED